jgi:hypothetical protein
VKFTNKYHLPQPIVSAIANDPYDKGDSDYSVTQLIDSAQISHLKEIHQPVEDVSDRLFSFRGNALHDYLEQHAEGITEERLYLTLDGVRVSGKFDWWHDGILTDWKEASVWEYIFGLKKAREQQLNLLAFLCNSNGLQVNKLRAGVFFRDWKKSESLRNPDYPPIAYADMWVPLWPSDQQYNFLLERIKAHQEVPECTDEERWYSGEKFAIMKNGRKSALRLLDTEEEAVNSMGHYKGDYIEHRPGIYRRCEDWCPVRHVCPQNNS